MNPAPKPFSFAPRHRQRIADATGAARPRIPVRRRWFPSSILPLLLPLLFCLAIHETASADIPLPERILNPLSAAEAWNVIHLATANVERLLEEKRPLEVSDQISLCSPSLRVLARTIAIPGAQPSAVDDAFTRAYRSVNLIARESAADNLTGVQSVYAEFQKYLRELEPGFNPAIVRGEIFHCPDHPEVTATKPGEKCDKCGRAMLARRIPYSFIYVKPAHPVLKLAAHTGAPLKPGTEARVSFRLETLDGKPANPADLEITHTLRVHVLVTGPGRKDYHYRAPAVSPSGPAGEYTFSFTPSLPGPYRMWAGVVPMATALQEYPSAELPGEAEAEAATETDAQEVYTADADGMRFQLSIMGSRGFQAYAGHIQAIRLTVTDAGGEPVRRLEPFNNAFAHLAGFYTADDTVLQLHPVGGDILLDDVRGGPELAFKFYAPRPGLLRLYCQVRVDGKEIVVPFAINVRE